jgi:tetratricopeptide (TPR) repeat protein
LSYELGTEHWFYGNIEAAAVFLEEALSRIDGLEEPFLRGRILNSYAFVKQSLNEFDRSWEMALEAEQIFRRLESPYFRSMVLTNLGYLADDFGRLLQARDFHLEALSLRQPFEVEELIAASEYGLARIERRMGLLADAASRLEANLAGQGIRNRPFDHFDNMEELAEVRMRQGRFDEAARFLDQAQALAAASDDTIGLAWSAEVRGRLAVASDRLEPDVRQDLLAAIKALEGLGDDQEVFTASLTLVEFMQQSGETAEAEVRLAALADHPALANPVHHIRYRIVRGRQAALIGLADESRNLLEAALLRARQLGSVDQEAAAAIELAWQAHRRGEPNAAQRYLRIARRWAPEDFRTAELERAMPTQAES